MRFAKIVICFSLEAGDIIGVLTTTLGKLKNLVWVRHFGVPLMHTNMAAQQVCKRKKDFTVNKSSSVYCSVLEMVFSFKWHIWKDLKGKLLLVQLFRLGSRYPGERKQILLISDTKFENMLA